MKKLTYGDHIRVLSPSNSIESLGGFKINLPAKRNLEKLGFSVSFSNHYMENDLLGSSSIASRVSDIHDAFKDNLVNAILPTIGGFNVNEILPYLDYELIKSHPKIICGYSDTTALLNAIYAKTGMETYMGPSYSSFKMKEGQDYQSRMWLNAMTRRSYNLVPSKEWTDDPWYDSAQQRHFKPTEWKIYNMGSAQGTAIGGNLSSFHLLAGTEFAPKPDKYILFLEGAEEEDYRTFSRCLSALLQIYPEPQALVFGRFPEKCGISEELFHFILNKYPHLQQIPVMYDLDFAHTQPLFTFTIGAEVTIDTISRSIQFKTK
ncbi:S66 peptidase family protein [Streptococcus macacae]|uniref:LD-carboxypeptidase n=1 Tax=Streptococcus macacae NCTC 11558 TaxID=764298 RepID=G5JW81_9STRE|nr:S66 peptidase family protein [Streptococcus macacae]EHJ52917.1 LD-carboxypeptidase [Streptococcus macacae NCTC 11558]SUN79429.1 bacteriocin immunity protein [Streptococcus macacae NCTC 11558]